MIQGNKEILKKINQLITILENLNIQKTDRLKILKVLLAIKLRLIEFLIEVGKDRPKIDTNAFPKPARVEREQTQEKLEIVLSFIKNNGGKVSSGQLISLGIAGRSLRRYIKNLRDSGKILIDKKGREHFYTIIS